MKKHKAYLLAAIIIIFVDQITKFLAVLYCQTDCFIAPFLSFFLAYNRGIAWGIGNHAKDFVVHLFIILSCLVTFLLTVHVFKKIRMGKNAWPEVIIISGSCSNILDKCIRGGVIDFIHFFYNAYSFPLFNIADIFIVSGVLLLLISFICEKE